ncbi:pentatricopeptide repeat domain-containing protein (PPR motif) [Meinhardsimonia xiamenensis]|jgi:pentatricopeptide repeat protein|uniref:Pentatricopeptide repeat domain-containing protein (PPR motif) n=1 Tax=Meinhardsimonia xiamenensis TaxID=990712 RepID=A0A1G9CM77_9RHOB|nr:tetratricopeptide repeat protein [Meinhardsimonia xiamenensis]PRX38313.1 pentatricopeptide repeat protein [Meinhardsimonia xiamenensis]SDK52689.1 pentatricopeptide repeat domain-containing protein (PPR motif) [Meinhardsimonia xiamenensis]
MRQGRLVGLLLCGTLALAGCTRGTDADVERAMDAVNVIDESNLGDIMLTVADPEEAVAYFSRSLREHPGRIDLERGLAKSLVRARRPEEAVKVWKRVMEHKEVTDEDRVDYADALIRVGDWERAEATLNSVPPTYETYKRYRLEAMVADSNRDWKRADAFYETAAGLTTKPAAVLNNWGYSKLTRGDHAEAERLFLEAVKEDPSVFTAKNNLVLARAAQRKYTLPPIPMTQVERAQLLHTMALAAIKQGDVNTGRTLLEEAIETHPQHFEAAVRALRALESNASL